MAGTPMTMPHLINGVNLNTKRTKDILFVNLQV